MLLRIYKSTCPYSFAVLLSFSQQQPPRRTLPVHHFLAYRDFTLHPKYRQMPHLSLVTCHLRQRILPQHGLALVDSSIQSP